MHKKENSCVGRPRERFMLEEIEKKDVYLKRILKINDKKEPCRKIYLCLDKKGVDFDPKLIFYFIYAR